MKGGSAAGKQPEWKAFWQEPKQRIRLTISIVLLPVIVYGFSLFLGWVEQRDGLEIDDPVLSLFQPVDISALIFAVTYLPVIAGIIYAARDPWLLLRTLYAYSILLLLRTITIYCVPLDPPADIIPLRDPVLELTAYSGKAIVKDLFFSGHTATHFMFFLLAKHKGVGMFFLMCTFLVGVLVLAQHVHYTVDVLAAPAFAWMAVRLSLSIEKVK